MSASGDRISPRDAEVLYRGLFESVPDAILVADNQARYLDANPAAQRLLGYDREQLLGMRVPEIVANGTEWGEREFAQFVLTGHWQGELDLRRVDGTLVAVEARATVVQLPHRTVYVSVIRENSEERRAAAELYRREQEFKAVVESAPDIIARYDRDLRCVYVNPAIERAWGLAVDTFLGKRIDEFALPVPNPTQAMSVLARTLEQVFANGKEQSVEVTAQLPGGERTYLIRAAPELAPDGTVASVVAVSHDISTRKRRELDQATLYRELIEREERLHALVRRALQVGDSERRARGETESGGRLTRRELEILQLLAQGLTNGQIGQELGLATGTVKNHVGELLPKLGAADRTRAAVRAFELGLLETPGNTPDRRQRR